MYNKVNVGYLDNILYDFSNKIIPIDNFNNYGFDGLEFGEITKIKKYFNLTLINGFESVFYLKLCYIIYDIINKYAFNYIGLVGFKRFKESYFK